MNQTPGDQQLLEEYVRHRSPDLMGALIDRHIDFVFNAAVSQVRDPAVADDITQAVFIVLAKKPASATGRSLQGWLLKTTRFCVANALRSQARRQRHERAAARPEAIMHDNGGELESLASHLEQSLAQLRANDREIILLRFTQDRDMSDIAAILGINEVSARKRLSRALERLRGVFSARGVTPSSAALMARLAMPPARASANLVVLVKSAAAFKPTSAGAVTLSAKVLQSMLWFEVKFIATILMFSALAGTSVAAIVRVHASHVSKVLIKTTEASPASAPVPFAAPRVVAALPVIPIPAPTEKPPGRIVQVASRLNEEGRPVLISVPLLRDLDVTEMTADDSRTIPQITLPRGSVTLGIALETIGIQANVKFNPLLNEPDLKTKLTESGRPTSFWEADQDMLAQAGLRSLSYADDPERTLTIEPRGSRGTPRTYAGPWGLVTFNSVARSTLIVPPAWQFRDTVTVTGQFHADPSLQGVVIHPVQTWADGSWQQSPTAQIYTVGSFNYSQLEAYAPASFIQGKEIPVLKCRIPLKAVHRMHLFETDLKPGDNIAIAIGGFVIHFFGLRQSPQQVTFSFGMIRQPGQSAENFKENVIEYTSWMRELKVIVGDGHLAEMRSGSGRGGPDSGSYVMENNFDTNGSTGPVRLSWRIPAVVQRATVDCTFSHLEIP